MPDDLVDAETLAGLAWNAYERGQLGEATRLVSRASEAAAAGSRRERQLIEVVCLAVTGDTGRAYGLSSEHLAEFPQDALVRRVQAHCA